MLLFSHYNANAFMKFDRYFMINKTRDSRSAPSTPITPNQANKQGTSNSRGNASTVFKHLSTRSKSFKEAEQNLPKSPRKRKKVVKMIASKTLRIKLYDNQGRQRQELSLEQEKWLLDFLERPDISRQTTERKGAIYIEKLNGERQYKQKI